MLGLSVLSGSAGFAGMSRRSRHPASHVHGLVHGTSGSHGSGGHWWVGLVVVGVVIVLFGFAVRHLLRRVASRR